MRDGLCELPDDPVARGIGGQPRGIEKTDDGAVVIEHRMMTHGFLRRKLPGLPLLTVGRADAS